MKPELEKLLGIGKGHNPGELCCDKCELRDQILALINDKLPKERTEYGEWSNPHDEHHQDGYNEAVEEVRSILK